MRAFIDTKGFAIAPRAHNIILFISCQVPAGFKETGQEKGVYNMNCSTAKKVKIKKKVFAEMCLQGSNLIEAVDSVGVSQPFPFAEAANLEVSIRTTI